MENLAYLGRFSECKRGLSRSVEIDVTPPCSEAFALRQPHPPPQPDLLTRQLRHVWRPKYQTAPVTIKPTGISCHSTARSSKMVRW